jgi:diguanylate cyclase (GGDEF)-like protein/PAS domain S-box-containing protein
MEDTGQDPAEQVGAAALRDVVNLLAGTFFIINEAGHFVLWNRRVEQVSGLAPSRLHNMHMLELVVQADRAKVAEAFCTVFNQNEQVEVEANLLLKGKCVPYALWGSRMCAHGRAYLCGMGMDLQANKRQRDNLALYKRALHAASNGIVITRCAGPDNPIEYVNPAFERISGYCAAESLGRDARFMTAPGLDQAQRDELKHAIQQQRAATVVFRNCRKDGEQFWNQLSITPVRDSANRVSHFIGILEDITALKERTARLEHQVTHDPLTGVANRTLLRDHLELAIHAAARKNELVAVALMDLNKFKEINDTLGHDAGDEVLRQVAARLQSATRDTDTVARLGGDEFVLILAAQPSLRFILRSLERVRLAMAAPLNVAGRRLSVGASMGIALFPQDGKGLSELLKAADAAMYAGKCGGPDAIHFYSSAIASSLEARRRSETALREALDHDDIFLVYQPHVCVSTGKLHGLEALLRWRHPERGELLPADFLPDAEENGLIIPLGRRVLEEICATLIRLNELGFSDIPISMNASRREFSQRDYLTHIANRLAYHGANPERLTLELCESQLMRHPEQARHLAHGMEEIGIGLALDEFGGGLTNLCCLQAIRVRHLKMVAKSVQWIGDNGDHGVLARNILDIGHNLNIGVIATAVENSEQRDFLAANRCPSMQGRFVSAPLTSAALEQWLGTLH